MKKLAKKKLEQTTDDILSTTLEGVVEGITGIAVSSKKELILSVSHIFQRMRGAQFLAILLEEWKKYREKGKIKDDYQYTEQHKTCLQELLDSLDNDLLDETRFEVLKKIFLVAASEEFSDRESLLPQQFMKIARNLSSGEVIVLTTVYKIASDGSWENKEINSAAGWLSEVTEKSGLQHRELVEIYEQNLMDKKLITPRRLSDKSGVTIRLYYRLSALGYAFCKYVSHYDG